MQLRGTRKSGDFKDNAEERLGSVDGILIFVSSTFLAEVITVTFISGARNICTNKR